MDVLELRRGFGVCRGEEILEIDERLVEIVEHVLGFCLPKCGARRKPAVARFGDGFLEHRQRLLVLAIGVPFKTAVKRHFLVRRAVRGFVLLEQFQRTGIILCRDVGIDEQAFHFGFRF